MNTLYEKVTGDANASTIYQVIAHYGLADAHAREKNAPAAQTEYDRVLALPNLPAHLGEETRLRKAELTGDPAFVDQRITLPVQPKPAVEYYVAVDGKDDNPGTLARPFASLARARDAVRAARQGGALPAGGAAVFVRGGEYRVEATFELGDEDSGTAEAPVVYRAYPGEKPTFYGGTRLSGFRPVTEPRLLARLPAESRGKVVELDLKASDVSDLSPLWPHGWECEPRIHTEIFWNEKVLTPARWPNEGYVKTVARVGEGWERGRFVFDSDVEDRGKRWKQAGEIMLYGFWNWDFASSVIGPASLDLRNKQFSIDNRPENFAWMENEGEVRRFYVFNLLEEIDQPGEYYIDREAKRLYVYPPSDPAGATVEVSMLNVPFVKMARCSHVMLRGLRFDCGRHSGILMEEGRNNLIAGCTVSRLAWDGIVVQGGHRHGIFGCDVSVIGRSPVRVSGGDEITLEPGGHFIENCHIRDFSRLDRSYTEVDVSGVGNRCVHNRIHTAPFRAIGGGGNDRLIAYNEVFGVVREINDQGAIDFGFDTPASRGGRILFNFVHDTGGGGTSVGTMGVRLDDAQSGELIYGNVFHRAGDGGGGAVNIHGGKDNLVDNNLFIDCGVAFGQSPWGQSNWEERLRSRERHGPMQGSHRLEAGTIPDQHETHDHPPHRAAAGL